MDETNGLESRAREAHRHLQRLRQSIGGAFLSTADPQQVARVLAECLEDDRAEVRLKACRLYLQNLGRFTKLAAGNDPAAPRTVPRPMSSRLLQQLEGTVDGPSAVAPEGDRK